MLFREVFKAKDKKTGRLVALKKVIMENEKEGVSRIISIKIFHRDDVC